MSITRSLPHRFPNDPEAFWNYFPWIGASRAVLKASGFKRRFGGAFRARYSKTMPKDHKPHYLDYVGDDSFVKYIAYVGLRPLNADDIEAAKQFTIQSAKGDPSNLVQGVATSKDFLLYASPVVVAVQSWTTAASDDSSGMKQGTVYENRGIVRNPVELNRHSTQWLTPIYKEIEGIMWDFSAPGKICKRRSSTSSSHSIHMCILC